MVLTSPAPSSKAGPPPLFFPATPTVTPPYPCKSGVAPVGKRLFPCFPPRDTSVQSASSTASGFRVRSAARARAAECAARAKAAEPGRGAPPDLTLLDLDFAAASFFAFESGTEEKDAGTAASLRLSYAFIQLSEWAMTVLRCGRARACRAEEVERNEGREGTERGSEVWPVGVRVGAVLKVTMAEVEGGKADEEDEEEEEKRGVIVLVEAASDASSRSYSDVGPSFSDGIIFTTSTFPRGASAALMLLTVAPRGKDVTKTWRPLLLSVSASPSSVPWCTRAKSHDDVEAGKAKNPERRGTASRAVLVG